MTTPSLEIDFSARLCASLDGMAAAMDRESRWRQRCAQAITQIPFAASIPVSGGDGLYDVPDQMQAKTGFIWSVRRITAYGFTAGTVVAYRNSAAGEPVMPFAQAEVNTLSRGSLLLMPGDRLVWAASGISGTVSVWGVADCFESWYLPFYIG